MTSLTTPAHAEREVFLHTSPANAVTGVTSSNLATRIGANLGAGLLISASAAIGAYYGYATGAHVHIALGVVLCAAALGGELLKPIAVAAAIDAFRRLEFGRGAAAVLLALVTVTYSLASELSVAAGVRGDVSAERQGAADHAQRWRAKRTRAADELAALPFARPAAELEPLIAKALAVSGANGCGERPATPGGRRACAEAADMSAELGRAQRRTALESAIAEADRALSTPGARTADTQADPLAASLSAYVSAVGHTVKPADITPWLALIPVLFLEIGSALAVVVARAAGAEPSAAPPAPSRQSHPSIALPVPSRAELEAPSPPAKPVKARRGKDDDRGPRGGKRLASNVVALLRREGGRIEGGQRGIAEALGISKSRTNEILRELADAGEIVMAAGKQGTTLALRA